MIKISHVMTIDTNEHIDMLIVYVYNFVFNVYNITYRSRETIVMKYVRYVLQAK